MILEITYGYSAENVDDPFVHLADEAAFESLRYCAQGATICDVLPIRKEIPTLPTCRRAPLTRNTQVKYWPTWMPFSFYQRHAARTRSLVEKLFSWPLELVQQRIVLPSLLSSLFCQYLLVFQANDAASPSLARDLLAAVQGGQKVAGETLNHEDVKHICGALYGGT
jgi:hypothetical protein